MCTRTVSHAPSAERVASSPARECTASRYRFNRSLRAAAYVPSSSISCTHASPSLRRNFQSMFRPVRGVPIFRACSVRELMDALILLVCSTAGRTQRDAFPSPYAPHVRTAFLPFPSFRKVLLHTPGRGSEKGCAGCPTACPHIGLVRTPRFSIDSKTPSSRVHIHPTMYRVCSTIRPPASTHASTSRATPLPRPTPGRVSPFLLGITACVHSRAGVSSPLQKSV